MKKAIIIVWLSILTIPLFSYTWIPYCPDTIHANNVCFGVGSWKGTICTPEGMYLWEDDIMEWSFYTNGLPVTGAASLDATKILVAMGDGSWSDGVYTFNLETHQFEVVEWIVNPNFLIQIFSTGKYYIGSQFGGLYESSDGLNWSSVPYFDAKSCTAMDFYDNHLVVTEVSNVYDIYISDDYGDTWQEAAAGSPMITDLKFSYDGDLYGIFPDYSNSSGLWSSDDWGNTWEVEFWSDNMSTIGFDAMSTAFVGWESPTGGNEGIAIYTPYSPPPNLAPLNNGLPNLNINKILLNTSMSAVAIFCCTDAGVYVCYDYFVGEDELKENELSLKLFPNPTDNPDKIWIEVPNDMVIKDILLFTNQGRLISKKKLNPKNSYEKFLEIGTMNLPAGTYFILVSSNKKVFSEKLIIY